MKVLEKLGIGVVEEEVIVDELLAGHDAEQVNQALGLVADVAADDVAGS